MDEQIALSLSSSIPEHVWEDAVKNICEKGVATSE
jgi:hypothetical protein